MARVAQEKLSELPITGKTLAEHARQLKDAITKRKEFEAQMDQQKNLVHRLQTQVIPPLLDDEDSNGKNIIGVGYLELGVEIYPYVKKDDEQEFFGWLRDEGYGGIIKETIHHKTLQAWAGEMIDDPEKAGKLPDMLTVAKVPTAVLKAEKTSSKRR